MKRTVVALLLVVAVLKTSAQDAEPAEKTSTGNVGLGLGLDYGGIGGRFSVLPSPSIGLFAGLGYNFRGAGVNGGAIIRLFPKKRICPTLLAMYGYNAVIVVKNYDFSKTYYGPSFGFGTEFHSWHNRKNFFNIELLIPVRSSQFHDDMDALKATEYIDIKEPWPVMLSLGYHFGF